MKRLAILLSLSLGSAMAVTPDTYLEHGLNDNASTLFTNFINEGRAYAGNMKAKQYDTAYHSINSQAEKLAAHIKAESAGKPIVLVGHSMGGLRARQYAQYMAPTPTLVRGLITMGTPNAGAPVVNNAPVLINRINRNLSLVSLGLWPMGLKLFTGAWSANENPAVSYLSDQSAAGVRDMSPTSPFYTKLNNMGMDECTWQSYKIAFWTHWYQVCKKVDDPSHRKLSNATQMVSVRGTNSDFLNMAGNYSGNYNMLMTIRNGGYALGAAYTAAAFWTWGATLPMAAAAFDTAYIANNAHSIWRTNVMGSQAGDSIVPLESQSILAANSNMGGAGHTLVDVDAVHVSYDSPIPNEVDAKRTMEAYRDVIRNTSY